MEHDEFLIDVRTHRSLCGDDNAIVKLVSLNNVGPTPGGDTIL